MSSTGSIAPNPATRGNNQLWEDYLTKRGAKKENFSKVNLSDGLDAEEEGQLGITDKNRSEAEILRKGWKLNGENTRVITIEALQKREDDIKAYASYLMKINPEDREDLSKDQAMLKARELYAAGTDFEARELNADAAIKEQANQITKNRKVSLPDKKGPLWDRVKLYFEAHNRITPEQAAKYILWVTEALKYEESVQTRFFKLETLSASSPAPPAAEPASAKAKSRVKTRPLRTKKAEKKKKANAPSPEPAAMTNLAKLITAARAKITAADKETDNNKKLPLLQEAREIKNKIVKEPGNLNDAQRTETKKIAAELTWKILEAEGKIIEANAAKSALGVK